MRENWGVIDNRAAGGKEARWQAGCARWEGAGKEARRQGAGNVDKQQEARWQSGKVRARCKQQEERWALSEQGYQLLAFPDPPLTHTIQYSKWCKIVKTFLPNKFI